MGHHLDFKYWDKSKRRIEKYHSNPTQLNTLIATKQVKANSILLDTTAKDGSYSFVGKPKTLLSSTLT